MSLRETIELWKNGVDKANEKQYHEAIKLFLEIPEPGARIYFNVANMYINIGSVAEAEKSLDTCVKKDPHLAIGYFQRGCIHILNKKYREAIGDFELALRNLRGNLLIDYKQLGLLYKLYSSEVIYNKAYCLMQLRDGNKALELLEEALGSAAESSESRHRVISTALEKHRRGEEFLPYRLPKTALLFVPPRTKTDVLSNIDFLGKAKVVSSVVDQDDFTGFVGAQKREASKSPGPGERKGIKPEDTPAEKKGPKPGDPPPKPNLSIPKRETSLQDPTSKESKQHGSRPPKPSMAPPPPRPSSRSPVRSPVSELHPRSPAGSRSPSPRGGSSGAVTVKVHYSSTRAIRVASSITYEKLLHLICHKFDKPDNSLTLWYKCSQIDDLKELRDDPTLKTICRNPEEGFRITLWAYDLKTEQPHTTTSTTNGDSSTAVLKEVVAIGDFTAQSPDELSFYEGEIIQVISEVDDNWYYGTCQESAGIVPKTFVRDM